MESVPVSTTQVAHAHSHSRVRWTERLGGELTRALRGVLRSPGFALIVIVTLALGLGAATAIFTMLDRVVLQPLPYQDAGELVWLDSPTPKIKPDSRWGLSVAEYFLFKKEAHTLQDAAVLMPTRVTVTGTGSAERVPMAVVSGSIFDVLRLRPMLGRVLTQDDNLPNAPRVVVLGYDFWKTHYHGDPHAVGTMMQLATTPHQIVGVMGPDATIPDVASPRVDVWLPKELDPSAPAENAHYLSVVARLAPGVTVAAAQADMARLTGQLITRFPNAYGRTFFTETGFRTAVTPLRERVIGDLGHRLWILLGAVLLVLVIACGNVANLFLVRAESRQRETAIRSALGARRRDLAWQYLTESTVLALIAGALALTLAAVGIRIMIALAPTELPRAGEIHIGWLEVLFAVVISLLSGATFGALMFVGTSSRTDARALRAGGRGSTASRGQHFARGMLAATQTALALVLLAGAGLLLQSFRNLSHVAPGFDPTNVLTAEISLPYAHYPSYEATAAFYQTLMTRVAALPGVRSAGAGTVVPLGPTDDGTPISGFAGCSTLFVDPPLPHRQSGGCFSNPTVAPGYFHALGIHVRGAEPSWSDVEGHTAGVVITHALAEQLWPGQDALGRGIKGNGRKPPFYRIVGVADDFRGASLTAPPVAAAFFPLTPIPDSYLWSPTRDITIVIRTNGIPPTSLTGAVRHLVTSLDPDVAIATVRPMSAIVAQSMARLSFTMTLLGIAAGMALILSAIGIYGVISYVVSHRTSEIGIRMALGAHASRVGGLVVWQSVRLAALGVAVGIVGALAMSRVLRSVLFEVSPTDPIVLVIVSAIMLVIAALASYAPAARAMRVDPVEALRAE